MMITEIGIFFSIVIYLKVISVIIRGTAPQAAMAVVLTFISIKLYQTYQVCYIITININTLFNNYNNYVYFSFRLIQYNNECIYHQNKFRESKCVYINHIL